MRHLRSVWARAHESLKHDFVDVRLFRVPVLLQHDALVAPCVAQRLEEYTGVDTNHRPPRTLQMDRSIKRSYAPLVTDFIQPLKASHRSPLLTSRIAVAATLLLTQASRQPMAADRT